MRPPDGRYILAYKGVGDRLPPPQYGPVLHGVAFADRPEGPFVKHPDPIFAIEGAAFPGENPFVWCQDGRYCVLLKDQSTYYSPSNRAIVRVESEDGLHWALSGQPVFQERVLLHADGGATTYTGSNGRFYTAQPTARPHSSAARNCARTSPTRSLPPCRLNHERAKRITIGAVGIASRREADLRRQFGPGAETRRHSPHRPGRTPEARHCWSEGNDR